MIDEWMNALIFDFMPVKFKGSCLLILWTFSSMTTISDSLIKAFQFSKVYQSSE